MMLQFGSPFKLCWGGIVVAFCGRILAPVRWNLQMSWYKCPGVPRGQPPGMAADKCITLETSVLKLITVANLRYELS